MTAVVGSALTGPDSCQFNLPANWITTPQINMVPHPVNSHRHWDNQPALAL